MESTVFLELPLSLVAVEEIEKEMSLLFFGESCIFSLY
jgi:hypothetical protein